LWSRLPLQPVLCARSGCSRIATCPSVKPAVRSASLSAEAKVGLFFLIALVLVGTIALYMGDFWVRARSYR